MKKKCKDCPFNTDKVMSHEVEPASFKDAVDRRQELKAAAGAGYQAFVKFLINEEGWDAKALAENTLLDESMYEKITGEAPMEEMPVRGTAMSLCIGLRLEPSVSRMLFEAAGLGFSNSREHCAHEVILDGYCGRGVAWCSRLLVQAEFRKLERAKWAKGKK